MAYSQETRSQTEPFHSSTHHWHLCTCCSSETNIIIEKREKFKNYNKVCESGNHLRGSPFDGDDSSVRFVVVAAST